MEASWPRSSRSTSTCPRPRASMDPWRTCTWWSITWSGRTWRCPTARVARHGSRCACGPERRAVKLAYLVNQYPTPSHAARRRELLAVEAAGAEVFRYSIRRTTDALVDPVDQSEAERTTTLLDVGLHGLAWAAITEALSRPRRFWRALALGVRIGLHSDRGLLRNLVYVAEACVLRRSLERRGVQHVHSHFGTNGTAVAMLCRELGGPPYSFTVHGPYEFDAITGLAMDRKIARASFVVAISYFCRSQLFRWCSSQD